MLPENEKDPLFQCCWNGGRNGYHNFLLGYAWSPDHTKGGVGVFRRRITLYLGLWILNIRLQK